MTVSSNRVDEARNVAVHRKDDVVGPKEIFQSLGRGPAEAAVGCWVLGMIRGDDESYPRRIRRGVRVTIGIARSNGGDGGPADTA